MPQEPQKKKEQSHPFANPQEPSPYTQPKIGYTRSKEEADRANKRVLRVIGLGVGTSPTEDLIDNLNDIMRNAKSPGLPPDTRPSDNKLPESFGSMMADELGKIFTEVENAKGKRDDSLTTALEQQRAQELHELELKKGIVEFGQVMQDIKSNKLKDDKAILDMEVTKAEAVKEGLAIPPEDPAWATKIRPPKWPSDGKAVEYMLTGQSGNVSAGIMDAIASQMKLQEASGRRSNEIESAEKKFGNYLIQEIGNMLKKADEEKHLSMTPFGVAGGFLGGLMDIISGPLDLGTEIFGGKMSSAQKVEMLGRVYAQTNPLVRAQMDDMLGRERMEMTHDHWLRKNGLGSMTPSVKNMEEANKVISYSIDIRNTLANDEGLQDTWGTDSTTGIGQAFNAYENIHKLLEDLAESKTPEQTEAIAAKLIRMDAAMREPIRQYLARGGTPQQIQDILRRSVDRINKDYQQPLQFDVMGKDRFEADALKKATAFDFTSKLADFESAILQDIPLDIKSNIKKRFGEKVAARIESGEGSIIKGATDEFKAALLNIEADVNNKTWNPGRIRSLLRKYGNSFQKGDTEKIRKHIISKAPKERHTRIDRVFEDWTKELTENQPFMANLRGSLTER